MKQVYQITEYGSFVSGRRIDGFVTLPESAFAGLENFILSHSDARGGASDLMTVSVRRGVGKVITAKNYVGVILMRDGTCIEILPKICRPNGCSPAQAKRLLIEMLKSLHDMPCKSLQTAHVDVEATGLFEVFIRMFIGEVFRLVKHGLKRAYRSAEQNGAVCRGRLIFAEHIRRNCAHRERVYAACDEYDLSRPENRLIKSALLLLYRQTASAKNKADLKTLLNAFDSVEPSADYSGDFSRIAPDRSMAGYQTALLWCRVFLTGRSFTAYAGPAAAQALLFPMETLFERYAARLIRKKLSPLGYRVSVQDRSRHLFTQPSEKFLLRPDMVITRGEDGAVFICDTKWKLLSGGQANYGISQADMYQMYAYQKRYGAESAVLLYPMCDGLTSGAIPDFAAGDGATVKIRMLDMLDIPGSLDSVIAGL